jgi:PP-loop superfamily ATP-utilizing enzyme
MSQSKKAKAVVWFSCGAASAVAGKLAIEKYGSDVDLVYCDTGSEHKTNITFLKECETWYDRKIDIIKNDDYEDHFDVVKKKKFITNQYGFAYCTHELKMKMRVEANYCNSINIFGYTLEEKKRAASLVEKNIDMKCEFPLIDQQVTKDDCLGIIWQEGIKMPLMYTLGYSHNNCVGCVKGGIGYWNRIRIDFPDVFTKMAKLEREINVTILKHRSGELENERMYLDELDPNAGNMQKDPQISCGIDCHLTINKFSEKGTT